MRKLIILLTLLLNTCLIVEALAQNLPLVYNVENTGANYPKSPLLTIDQLPAIQALPDPFTWADGRGRISSIYDWLGRRAEIKAQIENYEIGPKPDRPDTITASYSGGTLTVKVIKNGQTLTLTSTISLPSETGPFPAVIGMNSPSGSIPSTIFSSRNVALITYVHNQVTTYGGPKNTDPYYKLYPNLDPDNTGQYSAWAWGVSRIIDGLELVQNVLPIDLKHIAVSGCSYAGKLALFAGAFDERIALTFAQESGGGGATSWRYSHGAEPVGTVECIDNTDYNWFMNSMHQFASDNVSYLPEDHHELMAMCAPRALYVTANPGWTWLSNPSCYVCSKACQPVYNALGIADRFCYSLVGGHTHCALPDSQTSEIGAFVDKFLLGKDTTNTNISDAYYNFDLSSWIPWTTPTLSHQPSNASWTSLIYPSNLQKGLDKNITFQWNKVKDADKYFIQLSQDPTFTTIAKSDSTTTDTVKTITDFLDGKTYYWRVQIKNIAGTSGPWSNVWSFTTFIALPAKPQLVAATPYPNQPGWITFKWNKVKNADQYFIQLSHNQGFTTFAMLDSTTSDTVRTLSGFYEGEIYFWRVQAKNVTGFGPWSDVSNLTVTSVIKEEGVPTEYSVSQNYPNPFNPSTKLKFALPQRSLTKLTIYNLLGKAVQTLINKELEAGYHEIAFDANNFPSGVYYYRIQAGEYVQTKKMVLIK